MRRKVPRVRMAASAVKDARGGRGSTVVVVVEEKEERKENG
jgi:hypothetical protein